MTSLFDRIGGTAQLKQLADTFYDLMDSDQAVKELRDLHPENLTSTRKKLFRFLSHHYGGPSIYSFTITKAERLNVIHLHQPLSEPFVKQWLYCMNDTLLELEFDAVLRNDIIRKLTSLITAMQKLRKDANLNTTVSK